MTAMQIRANIRLDGKIEGEAPNVIKTFEGTVGVIVHQEGSQNLGNIQLVMQKLFKVSILQNFVSTLFELHLKGKGKNGRWTIQLHHHQMLYLHDFAMRNSFWSTSKRWVLCSISLLLHRVHILSFRGVLCYLYLSPPKI